MNPQATLPASQPKKSNRKLLLILAFLLLVICCICVVVTLLFLKFRQPEVVDNSPTPTPVVSSPVSYTASPTTKEFSDNYVSATLPIGWKIIEYTDKTGMDGFVDTPDTTITGLTGMEIVTDKNKIVFSINGVDGIGGGGGCTEIAKFKDTEASYIQDVVDETEMWGFGTTEVIDLTSAKYSQIFFFGLNMRRVGHKLYIAKQNNPTVFNTACGIEGQFILISDLGFTINDGIDSYTANAYAFGIKEDITDSATLTKLDDVLNSLKKN